VCVCVTDIYMNCKRFEVFNTERGLLEAKLKKYPFIFGGFFACIFLNDIECIFTSVYNRIIIYPVIVIVAHFGYLTLVLPW